MSERNDKSLMRSLGEFFGHIAKAVRTDPGTKDDETSIVKTTTEEEDRGDVILRRTVIEEVEVKKDSDQTE